MQRLYPYRTVRIPSLSGCDDCVTCRTLRKYTGIASLLFVFDECPFGGNRFFTLWAAPEQVCFRCHRGDGVWWYPTTKNRGMVDSLKDVPNNLGNPSKQLSVIREPKPMMIDLARRSEHRLELVEISAITIT
jgi:hypothetical protein